MIQTTSKPPVGTKQTNALYAKSDAIHVLWAWARKHFGLANPRTQAIGASFRKAYNQAVEAEGR